MTDLKRFVHGLWWMFLLRGLSLLAFGILAIAWPGLTLITLAFIFAVFLLLTGVLNIIFGVRVMGRQRMAFLPLVLGVLEVAAGVYMLRGPNITLSIFILVIGLSFIFQGVLSIIGSFDDSYDTSNRLLFIVSGVIGIIAGYLTIRYPAAGGIAFVWVIGVYGLISGSIITALALNLKSDLERLDKNLELAKA